MKRFSRYIFFLLAVFFISPLSGNSTQRYIKYLYKNNTKEITAFARAEKSANVFFCELEDETENTLEEDESANKEISYPVTHLLAVPQKILSGSGNSIFIKKCEKLFLVFHSLKLFA